MSHPTVQLGALFDAAHEDGELSAPSLQALTINVDIGAQIQRRASACRRTTCRPARCSW